MEPYIARKNADMGRGSSPGLNHFPYSYTDSDIDSFDVAYKKAQDFIKSIEIAESMSDAMRYRDDNDWTP